jgi:hypothetical protein
MKGLSSEDRKAHCVIYINGTEPAIDLKEQGLMIKKLIAVTAASIEQKLHKRAALTSERS